MEFIEKDKGIGDLRNPWGQGLLHIPVETLQHALDSNILKIDEDVRNVRKALQANIEWAKSSGEEWVSYYCA